MIHIRFLTRPIGPSAFCILALGGGIGGGGIGGGRGISWDDPPLTDSSIFVFIEKA